MVADPVDTPVTFPDASTVATAVLLLLQLPVVEVSVRVAIEPTQTPVGPEIVPDAGAGLTVIAKVLKALPQAPDIE